MTVNPLNTRGIIGAVTGIVVLLLSGGLATAPALRAASGDTILDEDTTSTVVASFNTVAQTGPTADENAGVQPVETDAELETVSAPEGYTERAGDDAAQIAADRDAVVVLDEANADAAATDDAAEELSLIRQSVTADSAVFGVVVDQPVDGVVYSYGYRSSRGGVWSDWFDIEQAETPEDVDSASVGSEPVMLSGVDEIEVAVHDGKGNAVPGARLAFINPEGAAAPTPQEFGDAASEESADAPTDEAATGETTDDAVEGRGDGALDDEGVGQGETTSYSATTATGLRATGLNAAGTRYDTGMGVTITTRKGWGADESLMTWPVEGITIRGAVIHHTAGTNDYTQAQVPGLVRSIYTYHAVTLGWGDIGYHILVDKYGGAWEGRAGGLTRAVEGGHAYGANSHTFGVSILGNYETAPATETIIDSVSRVTAWKLKVHGITDPNAKITVPGAKNTPTVTIPVVSGHRDVGYTACPGANVYSKMGEIRSRIATLLSASPQKPVARWSAPRQIGHGWSNGMLFGGNFAGDGHTDALLVKEDGSLWLYPSTNGGESFAAPRQIGQGWGAVDQVNAGLDFDGDGASDIVARNRASGDLYLYRGNGRGGFASTTRIGWGWQGFSKITAVDAYTDGQPAILAVDRASGRLTSYLTNGAGRFVDRKPMGTGWNAMRSFNVIIDRSGDGIRDLVVVDQNGKLWMYDGTTTGVFGARTQVGQGWGAYNPLLATADDGTFWTIDASGRLWSYRFIELVR